MKAEGIDCHMVCHVRNAKQSYLKLINVLTTNKTQHTRVQRTPVEK